LAAKPWDAPEALGLSHQAPGPSGLLSPLPATLLSCVLVLAPPAAVNIAASLFVRQAMEAVLTADEQQADLAIDEIRYLQLFASPQVDKLVAAYSTANEPSRKEMLKRRYLKLTGDDIEQRLAIMND
jgi:hypothetical protein